MGNKLKTFEIGADGIYHEKKNKKKYESKVKALFAVPSWIAINFLNFVVPYGAYMGAIFGIQTSPL